MKKNYLLSVIIIGLFFAGCSPKPAGVWVNKEKIKGKSFNNLFIVVVTADIEARVNLENDLAAAAISRGNKAVKSYEVMKPSLNDPKKPTKDEIVSKVKASGCDGVFIASLINKEESINYVPSTTSYSAMPYHTYYSGYYTNVYPAVHTPAYFAQEKNYVIQSNLYDAASEEIMWSVQSEVFTPSSLKQFSTSYISTLFKQLEKGKLLKK